jgi:hypothetical protein
VDALVSERAAWRDMPKASTLPRIRPLAKMRSIDAGMAVDVALKVDDLVFWRGQAYSPFNDDRGEGDTHRNQREPVPSRPAGLVLLLLEPSSGRHRAGQ